MKLDNATNIVMKNVKIGALSNIILKFGNMLEITSNPLLEAKSVYIVVNTVDKTIKNICKTKVKKKNFGCALICEAEIIAPIAAANIKNTIKSLIPTTAACAVTIGVEAFTISPVELSIAEKLSLV